MKVNTTKQALERLKAARDADYLAPWQPGKPRTDNELIWDYIVKLQDELSLKRDQDFLDSWSRNPDRMGGQFDESDYEQARRAEQGIYG